MKIVERKQQADSGLLLSPVRHFDLAQIVVAQEEAAAHGRRTGHDVAFTLLNHAAELRIVFEYEIHLALHAAGKALPAATERRAFGTYVMEDTVGESKVQIG